jgi:hypothetical protein
VTAPGRTPAFMLEAGNPMRSVLLLVLVFEAISFGLAIPVMIFVSQVSPGSAAGAGGAAVLLALIGATLLRRPIGYVLGWLTQLAGIALGFATWGMFVVGVLFAALWVLVFALGKRLQASRRAGGADADKVAP